MASNSDSDSKDSTESLTGSQSRHNVEDANRLVECTLSKEKPCQACERCSNLHNQIEATKKILEKLILEESEARMDMNRCHDPVQRLPPEITTHIFHFTVATSFAPTSLDSHAVSRNFRSETRALTLGAVCREWRMIAWATPQLWSTVILRVPWGNEPSWSKTNIIKEWLERSRPMPLTIRLYMNEYYEFEDADTISDLQDLMDYFVSVFNRHSDRWETLSVYAPTRLFKLFTGNQDGAPLLKTLHLILPDRPDEGTRFSLEGPMPQPEYVIAVDYRKLKYVGISWSNVTHAMVNLLQLEDCVRLLHLAPMLVSLRLQRIIQQGSTLPAVKTPSLVMHHLRTLEFTLDSDSDSYYRRYASESHPTPYSAIFDSVTIPLLEDLRLEGSGSRYSPNIVPFPFNSLRELLGRSFCPLINLRLDNFKCEQQAVLDLLYVLPPSVKSIRLDVRQASSGDDNHDLSLLFDHLGRNMAAQHGMPPGSQLLPNLENFEYVIESQNPETLWDRLPELLYPLSGVPRPLKKLSIIERSYFSTQFFFTRGKIIDQDAIRALMKLKDGGVDLFLPSEVSYEDLLTFLEE